MKKRYLILLLILSVILLAGCGTSEEGPELTPGVISQKLEAMSELVTAKLTYNGVIQYTDGNIPFLTKKEFLMVYRAEVKAGIDLSKVEIEITDTDVTVTIPDEVSVDVHVDPDSITFYAEKTALFNNEQKEDVLTAISEAEKDVVENGGIDELKKLARKEAIALIKGLVEELIGERTLTVVG